MITQTRHMLVAAIESLEDELAAVRAELDAARAELADRDRIRADRDRLREVVRMVVEKGRRVPVDGEPGRTAGVAAHFGDGEWGWIVAAYGGWPEGGAGG